MLGVSKGTFPRTRAYIKEREYIPEYKLDFEFLLKYQKELRAAPFAKTFEISPKSHMNFHTRRHYRVKLLQLFFTDTRFTCVIPRV